ncbi:hypothetical protein A1O3_09825 [Capronia epimyces CBS 606.96]|uniref:Myosin class II heavy chain n=1 Tax=Capronia epimyces CBS 606.96 TaxID=1182542 RepID=W9XBJ9_9EURO|nr:uncharacterized protein A1O3_09825 [Capronia epimyces CBS 606.96]EXJ77598.1 hypothetical protein A1O3_09825 [Capronia epimyces CBS 606.96]
MDGPERNSVETEDRPLPALPRRVSTFEEEEKVPGSPNSAVRPRPGSMQSYQRQKKKVVWKGKTCIIALPLTDRQATGLPPLLTAQEIKERIQGWIAAGYRVDGFESGGLPSGAPVESSGQSRPVYPDPTEIQAERKSRRYQVHVPDQAEWDSWVNYLKEEKLRALGVSPSNSDAPPPTKSPFLNTLSRVSSGYPGLAHSPPIAPSSSGSNPARPVGHTFSPSLVSSTGISPQPPSVTSSQFNALPMPPHGYKQSVALPIAQGRIISPFEPSLSQSSSFGPGARPNIQPLSSRQNSFSPNHPLHLPNLGEVLSPMSQSRAMDVRGVHANFIPESVRHNLMPSQGQVRLPQNLNQTTPSPGLGPRVDRLDRNGSSRPPIEIAHPKPKSHRHNLSMALQREIDEAEAALHSKEGDADATEDFDGFERKNSTIDESLHEELPILRRPETITDERSEIETNPSIAATPLLMDDKNPFVNWQALSDAAKAEPSTAHERDRSPNKFNVEAKDFDPRAGFSSTNFSFGGDTFTPFGLPVQPPAPSVPKPSPKSRISMSHLNADAPAFTPSFMAQKTQKEAPFKFSSATFNVEAPEFNPSRPLYGDSQRSVSYPVRGSTKSPDSIFGTVVVDPASKVSRRASKAVPILNPTPKHDQGAATDTDPEEDDGRPMAPTDRQKRVRRSSDGDGNAVYAESAPFHHSRILSEIVDDVDANGPRLESPEKTTDGWAYIPAEEPERQLGSNGEIASGRKEDELAPSDSDFTFTDQQDAAKFNEARPREVGDKSETGEDLQGEVAEDLGQKVPGPETSTTAAGHDRGPKPALSALAKPFELTSQFSSPDAAASIATPQKPQGLEASKYAVKSSPKQASTDITATLSSPPADLYHYAEPGTTLESDVEEVVEVFEESTGEDTAPSRREHESSPQQSEARDSPHHVEEDEFDTEPPRRRPQDEPVPSFEEIDAVMKQFEVHPELGIERNDTPLQLSPLIDLRLGQNFRSDAPSPSPLRPQTDQGPESEKSYHASLGHQVGVHNLNSGRDDVSEWDDTLPAAEEAKLQLRSEFFDGHVADLVGGLLENRLGPLERTLQEIRQSVAVVASETRPKSSRRSISPGLKNSDADDEDDHDAWEGSASYRTKSPEARRGGRKQDKIRAAVTEALATYQAAALSQNTIDMAEINTILQELRQVAQQTGSQDTRAELKTIVEDVISHHPRLRGSRVQQDHETTEMKYKPQIDGLESMLKISQEHAAEEARLRRQAEEEINELKLHLRIAEEEAAQYRESSEEAQHSLRAFVEEKESYKTLEQDNDALSLKNAALETTLEEYRVSSDQWREDIRSEREKNKELRETLRYLRQQLEDQSHSRQDLRTKLERVQAHMTQVVHDLHAEQADWREREHSLLNRLAVVQNELDYERRHREKAELDLAALDKDHRANLHFKTALEQSQLEVSRLNQLTLSLQEENRALDTKAFNLDRELAHVVNSKDAELATSTTKLQAELDSTKLQLQSIRTDSEAQILRLQSRLDHAELDIEDQKAKHDALMSETIDAHKEALREANEKRERALEDQHQTHEKKLNDLRDRHTRELHNSFDNRTRLEHHFNETLSLSNDKVKHLESKVADLEERLEITKSAARAAVEAAAAKGVNVPTPAPSVVASPPQRASSASISLVRGSDVPEKISPQALRESIMVLQDQLQNREQKIEKLESELAAVDTDAPGKLKERDTEITWLRELLNVRIDDLEDIINLASQPDFDRDSVKDAAIRLKANLQMEQQLKERTASGSTSSFPSLSALSSYAQSPRALPMAAAAAWGNWRRARDTSMGALSDLASTIGSQTQTPSKSTLGSPASFLSGIITPPSTSHRAVSAAGGGGTGPLNSNELSIPPPSMRPLAAVAAAAQARKGSGESPRPLRAWNSQPRSLSSRQQDKRRESNEAQEKRRLSPEAQFQPGPGPGPTSPRTPTPGLEKSGRPNPNSNLNLDLTEDVDDDASLLDSTMTGSGHLEDAEPEPEREPEPEPESVPEPEPITQ